jgi:hypothetical protein
LADADIKVVGQAGLVSLRAAHLVGRPCGGKEEHAGRMDQVARALLDMPEYQATGGTDFVTAGTYWDQSLTLGTALHEALLNPGLAGDLDFQPHESQVDSTLVIPYLPNYLLERSAAGVGGAPTQASAPTVSHMFVGNMQRRDAGSYRPILQYLAKRWPHAHVKDSDFNDWEGKSPGKQKHHGKVLQQIDGVWVDLTKPLVTDWPSEATALLYLRSAMCLVPAGDTATSRRVFDALAAGCVPVFFAHKRDIIANLPFPNVIDWASIAIFAGSLECIGGKKCVGGALANATASDKCASKEGMACWNDQECRFDDANHTGVDWNSSAVTIDYRTADWLEAIASSADGKAAMQCMSTRGRETFRVYLSYSTGGFVTGLLRELEARFVWPRPNLSEAKGGVRIKDWHGGTW